MIPKFIFLKLGKGEEKVILVKAENLGAKSNPEIENEQENKQKYVLPKQGLQIHCFLNNLPRSIWILNFTVPQYLKISCLCPSHRELITSF